MRLDNSNMKKDFFLNKSILITGGTGSFGRHFAKEVLTKCKPKKIICKKKDYGL